MNNGVWYLLIFFQCTASCGQGYQMRAVKCVNELLSAVLDDRLCHGASRPSDRQVKDTSSWIINKNVWYRRIIDMLKLFPYVFFPLKLLCLKNVCGGLPWWSSGKGSVLPMQGAWVRSLVRELDPSCCN